MQSRKKRQNRTHPSPALFGTLPRAICENLIAPRLGTRDLQALACTSRGTNACFDKQLILHEDAQEILQKVLDDSSANVIAALNAAKEFYVDDVWKLLLTPVNGGRAGESISVLQAAAWTGNLYQYLYNIDNIPGDANAVLELGTLYVSVDMNDNFMSYLVIDPEAKKAKGTIHRESLAGFIEPLDGVISLLYERGEANDVNPLHPEIAATYLLNQLFALFITDELRHVAIEQLKALQTSGSMMSSYVELLAEVDHKAPAIPENQFMISEYVRVKRSQLSAFISWQIVLEKKYRAEQEHSRSLTRRR